MAGELIEKVNVLIGEALRSGFVQELDDPDDLPVVMPHRHSQHGASLVIEFLIEASLEELELVSVFNIYDLTGFGNAPGDPMAERNPDLLVMKSLSNNRP